MCYAAVRYVPVLQYQLFKCSWDRIMFLIGFFTSAGSYQCSGSCVFTAASEKADVRVGLDQQQAGIGHNRNFCTASALFQ